MADITRARLLLSFKQPFFASILFRHNLIPSKQIPTAAVNQRGDIFYNAEWFEGLSDKEAEFVLCHEVMHVVCLHAMRVGSRDPQRWNYAGDAFINDYLFNAGLVNADTLKKYVRIVGASKSTTEEIYDKLSSEEEQQQASPCGGINGDVLPSNHPLQGQAMSESEKATAEVQAKLEVASAIASAKAMGKLPSSLERIFSKLFEVKTPWYELLERFFDSKVNQEITWTRPNRRYIDVYLPSRKASASLGTIVIGIDTSGSISQQELTEFASHIQAIRERCLPETTYVVYCDSDVKRVDELSVDDEFEPHPCGGGGTYMPSILEWIDKQGIEPDCVCILTDGYTAFEDAHYPVLWCMTTDEKSPYGETIKLEAK